MQDLDDVQAIQQLIAHFTNSFDLKAWSELGACLASTIFTDYSELRGTSPETMAKERFVESRRVALDSLITHHLTGNIEVNVNDARGEARVSMVIYRRNAEGQIFDTHCIYTLGVEKVKQQWLICSIVQKVLWNDGNKSIHRGIAKP